MKMRSLPNFILKITKDSNRTQTSPGQTLIIIERPYSLLQEELDETFKGQSGVDIIIDRRHGDRRITPEPVQFERRRVDRRRLKEKMVEVVMSV